MVRTTVPPWPLTHTTLELTGLTACRSTEVPLFCGVRVGAGSGRTAGWGVPEHADTSTIVVARAAIPAAVDTGRNVIVCLVSGAKEPLATKLANGAILAGAPESANR
jgi:hypothetical protein